MEVKFQVPEIFIQLQGLENKENALEKSRDMLQNIMNNCNTYADVQRMEAEGIISMEGILEIIQNYEDILGISSTGKTIFDVLKRGIENASRERGKKRKAI